MERKNLLKLSVVLVLSLVLLVSLTGMVYADDFWSDFEDGGNTFENVLVVNSTNTSNTSNSTNDASANIFDDLGTNVVDYNSLNENKTATNSNKANVANNAIPDTGIENTGSIITVLIVVGGVVAVYSYKKFNEYQNV